MFDPRKLVAEFVGTAILVFAAVGTATLSFGFKLFGTSYSAGVVTTALAFGLVLMALVTRSDRSQDATSTRRSPLDSSWPEE